MKEAAEVKFPLVGSIRVNRSPRFFTGTNEMFPKDGTVSAHSALLNGTFTSRDGSVTGVYASVFIPLEVYNAVLAEKSVNSVVEVRCVVTAINDKVSAANKPYKEAKVDEAGPKKVLCTAIENTDDYFGGDTFPIMTRRSSNGTACTMKV